MPPQISARSSSQMYSSLCTCQLISSVARISYIERTFLRSSSSTIAKSKSAKGKGKEHDRWNGWQPVIGLELHVQLKGNPKLFSSISTSHDAEPNTLIRYFDAALPGSLPILSKEPVRLALLACLALRSEVNPNSIFDRKHYFYPDLPAGFQITQKYAPLAKGGKVTIRKETSNGVVRDFTVGIDQVQLEQDTAKSSHDPETNMTLVDLNRAGTALVEIVTKPDMRSPEEAAAFVRHLQSILRHVGASDANMDKGELRCDVNVSVQSTERGSIPGTRCEVKNLNGVRFLVGAIESEIARQVSQLEAGERVIQATRGYNAITNQTFHLRSKEDSPDYRYMPDPELGPVQITSAYLSELESTLPELPNKAFDRLQSQYGLSPRDAAILVSLGEQLDASSSSSSSSLSSADGDEQGWTSNEVGSANIGVRYFETLAFGREAKVCANWVIHDLLSGLSSVVPPRTLLDSPISPHELGQLLDSLESNQLTSTNAKLVLKDFIISSNGSSWEETLKRAIEQHSASSAQIDLPQLCQNVLEALPKESEKVRQGNTKVLMRLVGEVMKVSKGTADAKKAKEVLQRMLLK